MKLDLHTDITEWDEIIEDLSVEEFKLLELKDSFALKSEEILQNTDFKELYGKNNETVRKNHINKELSSLRESIKESELKISYYKRRIDFLKSIIRIKTELIHYDGEVDL